MDHGVVYPLHVHQYGPRWRERRPPGFPEWVPYCGGPGSAYLMIDRWCAENGASDEFRDAMRDMSRTESYGGCLFLPGNPFDARRPHKTSKVWRFGNDIDGQLPRRDRGELTGAVFSTAKDALQWRGDTWETGLRQLGLKAGDNLPSIDPGRDGFVTAADFRPWDTGAWTQISLPLEYYWRLLWQPVAHHGPKWATLLCRLWHRSPGVAKQLRSGLAKPGAAPAEVWARVVSPVERTHLEWRWRTMQPEHDLVGPGAGLVDWDLAVDRWVNPW